MNDHRNSSPNDPSLVNPPSRRTSFSTHSSLTGQDSSSRNSRQSSYDDSKTLKQQLLLANKKLKDYELRGADYEQQISTLASQLKRFNDARLVANREAAVAKEELGLYKIQLEHANQEIRRAQQLLDKVENERYEAEKAAAEARTMARRYQRDLLMIQAMDEGRKMGMQEGIEQGRALALREAGEHVDLKDEDYANDYFDYTDDDRTYPKRSRSLLLAPNEEIIVHPPHSSTENAPSQRPAQPIPVPPPELAQPVPEPRPLSFRSPSPSVYHQEVAIPPEGYIPTVDANNQIRLPPPHELARPPPTPERPSSPQLPQATPEQQRPPSRSHGRRQSTASFASTSNFSNMGAPLGRNPLSAIMEVQSPHASPFTRPIDDQIPRYQPSRASSRHSDIPDQGRARSPQPIPRPPSATSHASQSLHPSSVVQDDHRRSTTSSSAPNISVVPPSRPLSSATLRSQHANSENNNAAAASRPTSMVQQLFGSRPFGQPAPSESGTADTPHGFPPSSPQPLPIPIPGEYGRNPEEEASIRERPRSRAASSTGRRDYDTMSIGSGGTLTTPQIGRRARKSSLDSWASPTPGNQSISGWEDAVRQAGSHVPLPFNS